MLFIVKHRFVLYTHSIWIQKNEANSNYVESIKSDNSTSKKQNRQLERKFLLFIIHYYFMLCINWEHSFHTWLCSIFIFILCLLGKKTLNPIIPYKQSKISRKKKGKTISFRSSSSNIKKSTKYIQHWLTYTYNKLNVYTASYTSVDGVHFIAFISDVVHTSYVLFSVYLQCISFSNTVTYE